MGIRNFAFTAFLALTIASWAQGKPTCEKYRSTVLKKYVEYCYQSSHPNLKTDGQPVVYFMHGLGGGAGDLELHEYASTLESMAKKLPFPMTFVSFDTAWNSFFVDHKGASSGWNAYETWFVEEFIDHVENKLNLCRERHCRGLSGVSMGGYGALKTALKYPELFAAVTGASSAIPPFNIHDADSKWAEYFDRHPLPSAQGWFFLNHLRKIMPTTDEFNENDPTQLVRALNVKANPLAIYFDCGGDDYFGFQEGYALFKSELEAMNIPFESFFDPKGTHDLFKERQDVAIGFLAKHLSE